MIKDAPIYVAGADTFLGRHLVACLRTAGYANLCPETDGDDLTEARAVEAIFARHRPRYVFVTAGRTGGIEYNRRCPADLMLSNLLVSCHVIRYACKYAVQKLLYIGSSCSYPRVCGQPMREDSLMSGPLEPTNEAYAMAKIAGMTLCKAYRMQDGANFVSALPANPYGPGDDFHPQRGHVICALMHKMHEAKMAGADVVEVWGTGKPRRDFIFIEDVAAACLCVMDRYDGVEPINLTAEADVSIAELAEAVKDVTGFAGRLRFNPDMPDGMPVKVLDGTKLRELGWRPRVSLKAGLEATYDWYRTHGAARLNSETLPPLAPSPPRVKGTQH